MSNWPKSIEELNKRLKTSEKLNLLKYLQKKSQKSFVIAKMSTIWPNINVLSSGFLPISFLGSVPASIHDFVSMWVGRPKTLILSRDVARRCMM